MINREFPILREGADGRRSVPWAWVAPHEAQARRNHGQTLAQLAERGGLAANELHAIVHGRKLSQRVPPDEAERWLAQWDGRPGTLEPGWTGPRCEATATAGRCKLPAGHEHGEFDVTTVPREHEFAPFPAAS